MALFGFFNYSKPGPGVDKNAPRKKRFFLFFELYGRKFWKLVQLNLLFCLCCIPIVTIGPAIAGMTYILRNFAQERPVFMVSDFFDAFKSNFKQSFLFWLLDTVITSICTISFIWYFVNAGMSWAMAIPLGICILIEVVLMFMRFHAYLMMVTVDLPLQHIIKNSLIFAFLGLKTNLISLFFVLLIMVPVVWFFPVSLLPAVLLVFSTVGFIVVFNAYPYLVKYIIEPHERKVREEMGEDEEDEDEDEDEDDEPIFTDIGTQEVAVETQKKGGKQKIIR